jgi:hypothetical protein
LLSQVHSSALDTRLNSHVIAKLNAAGLPVESIPTAFEVPGGYIARTLRLQLMYKKNVSNVEFLPVNAVLKMESESLHDRVVETLQLYRREWAFYQHTRHMIPLRIPRYEAPHQTELVEYTQKTYDVKANRTSPENNETHPSRGKQMLGTV